MPDDTSHPANKHEKEQEEIPLAEPTQSSEVTEQEETQFKAYKAHSAWLQLRTFQRMPLRLGEIRPKTRRTLRGPNRTMYQCPPSSTVLMEDDQQAKRQSIDSISLRPKRKLSARCWHATTCYGIHRSTAVAR